MSHMLLIGGRTPYKILFARSSGKTFQVQHMLCSCASSNARGTV